MNHVKRRSQDGLGSEEKSNMDQVKRRRVEWIGLNGERQDGLGSEDKIQDESCKEEKNRMNHVKRRRCVE